MHCFYFKKRPSTQHAIPNVFEWVRNTSTFTPECLDAYWKDADFFHHLYAPSENKRLLNWSRIVRTFHESGGDVNYSDKYRGDLLGTLNCIGDVLTPDVLSELIACGLTFEKLSPGEIASYGHIGSYAIKHNTPHKIDVMEMLNRYFDWIGRADALGIVRHVFCVNALGIPLENTLPLVKMHYRYDTTHRMEQLWETIPQSTKERMSCDVVQFMDSK